MWCKYIIYVDIKSVFDEVIFGIKILSVTYLLFFTNLTVTRFFLLQSTNIMKPNFKSLLFYFFIGIFTLSSCKKSNQDFVPSCSGTSTYSADAKPVFQSKCVSCHSNYGNYSQVVASKNSIRTTIINGSMPKGGSLTDAQKNAIICWIDAGAQNN